MKRINLKQTLKPFSSSPGIELPYPNTKEWIQFFPTCLFFFEEGKKTRQISFDFLAPAFDFKVFYSLVHQRFEVQIKYEKNLFHYHVFKNEKKWSIEVKRASKEVLLIDSKKACTLKKGTVYSFIKGEQKEELNSYEQLSFGCHKKSELERIYERKDFKELLPFFFLIGQSIEKPHLKMKVGPFAYFEKVNLAFKKKEHDALIEPLKLMLQRYFSPGLMPHMKDLYHWGDPFYCKTIEEDKRFDLLYRFYETTRLFFFKRKQNQLFFLPHLPKELPFGKGAYFKEKEFHFSFEWSKKVLKKLCIEPNQTKSFIFCFQAHLKTCRMQVDNKSICVKNGQAVNLESHKTYFFDRFEK